jgi:pimeloyl-ACP methyl ester carboxylesterase
MPIVRSKIFRVGAAIVAAMLAAPGQANTKPVSVQAQPLQQGIRYGTVSIDSIPIFYREAGPKDAPVIMLLHGFPASSFMYRDLMPKLSKDFRVIAPDYPGFGYSGAPSQGRFAYTFDGLANIMEKFIAARGIEKYALYMQDFGGPVGFRLATRNPNRITHLIIQNANAYEEGLPDGFWAPAKTLWKKPTAGNFAKIANLAMSDEALRWNYTHGVKDEALISPDSWILQRELLARPGAKNIMTALLYDYRTNIAQYSSWHRYFREHRPKTLIVWGKNDVIFPAEGARAYLKDIPEAELHLLESGHFALEDSADEIAGYMSAFLIRDAAAGPGR